MSSQSGDDEEKPGRSDKQSGVSALRDRIREAIVTREIPAGAVRTQTELAESLGVSRTPLREALRMLELEHLIVRESNGRFRVADFSLEEVEYLGVVRIALETAAVRLTVPRLTNRDHAELEGLLAQVARFAELGDWAEFERPHLEFHLKLTQGVGPMYTAQLITLWGHATRYRRAHEEIVTSQAAHAISEREHRAILDAVETFDADAAASLIAIQYARSALVVASMIDPNATMPRLRIALEAETGSSELPQI